MPLGAVNLKGGYDTCLIKHNNLLITVRRWLTVEWIDLIQMIENKLNLRKTGRRENPFPKFAKL